MTNFPPCFFCGRSTGGTDDCDGTIFNASGNYGSGHFDPIGRDRTPRLQIVICDDCLVGWHSRVHYITPPPWTPPAPWSRKVWEPEKDPQ